MLLRRGGLGGGRTVGINKSISRPMRKDQDGQGAR